MVRNPIILIAVIGLAIIVSGCVNSNEPTQKTQPVKIINLDPSQLILTDVDTNKVLGDGWNRKSESQITGDSLSYNAKFKGVNSAYSNDKTDYYANIQLDVFDINQSLDYRAMGSERKGNDIAIGDMGRIYSDKNYVEVDFIKSNVLILINGNNIGIEKTIELAKKQDEKISSILDMIK